MESKKTVPSHDQTIARLIQHLDAATATGAGGLDVKGDLRQYFVEVAALRHALEHPAAFDIQQLLAPRLGHVETQYQQAADFAVAAVLRRNPHQMAVQGAMPLRHSSDTSSRAPDDSTRISKAV